MDEAKCLFYEILKDSISSFPIFYMIVINCSILVLCSYVSGLEMINCDKILVLRTQIKTIVDLISYHSVHAIKECLSKNLTIVCENVVWTASCYMYFYLVRFTLWLGRFTFRPMFVHQVQ